MKHFWLYLRETVLHTFSAPMSGYHEVHLPRERETGARSGHRSGRGMIFPTWPCLTAPNKEAGTGWRWGHRSTLISWASSRITVIQQVQKPTIWRSEKLHWKAYLLFPPLNFLLQQRKLETYRRPHGILQTVWRENKFQEQMLPKVFSC